MALVHYELALRFLSCLEKAALLIKQRHAWDSVRNISMEFEQITSLVGSHQYLCDIMHAAPPLVDLCCQSVFDRTGKHEGCTSSSSCSTSSNRLFGTWRIPLQPRFRNSSSLCSADGSILDSSESFLIKSNQSKPPRSIKHCSVSLILLPMGVRLLLPFPFAYHRTRCCTIQNFLSYKLSDDLQRTEHDECTERHTVLASRSFNGNSVYIALSDGIRKIGNWLNHTLRGTTMHTDRFYS